MNVPLYTSGRLDALVESAEADRRAADADRRTTEADVAFDTARAYWLLALARADVGVLEQALAARRRAGRRCPIPRRRGRAAAERSAVGAGATSATECQADSSPQRRGVCRGGTWPSRRRRTGAGDRAGDAGRSADAVSGSRRRREVRSDRAGRARDRTAGRARRDRLATGRVERDRRSGFGGDASANRRPRRGRAGASQFALRAARQPVARVVGPRRQSQLEFLRRRASSRRTGQRGRAGGRARVPAEGVRSVAAARHSSAPARFRIAPGGAGSVRRGGHGGR